MHVQRLLTPSRSPWMHRHSALPRSGRGRLRCAAAAPFRPSPQAGLRATLGERLCDAAELQPGLFVVDLASNTGEPRRRRLPGGAPV